MATYGPEDSFVLSVWHIEWFENGIWKPVAGYWLIGIDCEETVCLEKSRSVQPEEFSSDVLLTAFVICQKHLQTVQVQWI